ncbi:AbrB/MazE/SpoVT family DNA-binding domain-containing protein [Deinococcus sp. SM5_A1]|uniref:AbrB/MazE/SpoVT family DNA-binding domain-containing protein n=1 Tax=Deinococcus sp. SM5_A1 TaxID=3379094 RepID=UPI0038581EFC
MPIKEARPTDEQIISATMTSKGQVTVPKAVRDQLGLEAGKKLDFILRGGEVVLRPQRPRRRSFFEAIGTLTPPDGMTAEEYISDMRHGPGDREILHSGPGVKKVTRISDYIK